MTQSITTSIRLPLTLRQTLDSASVKLQRGKNWIITEALKRYLDTLNQDAFKKEARRQSLLARKHAHPDDQIWDNTLNIRDWE